ncbi:hypothetical protein ACFQ3N_05445 [Virgibacillus byunsanensis]|uniref:Uncharacterized protein n=1 Tax=Virgibacillus byunsanensis TaxID=570945 RepID=A0ABW3LIT7_9BACI
MKNQDQLKKQIKNILDETNSSAVLNDVMNNGFEQYPGQNERLTNTSQLSEQEQIVRRNTDGKTWITRRNE